MWSSAVRSIKRLGYAFVELLAGDTILRLNLVQNAIRRVPDPLIWKGPGLELTSSTRVPEVRDLTNKGVGTLFEGKVIYDKSYGHVTYGCAGCCGDTDPVTLFFNPLSLDAGSSAYNYVYAYNTCDSAFEDVSDSFWNHWSSGNTSIVTINFYGNHSGVSAGSTTSQTYGVLAMARPRTCYNEPHTPSGGVDVTPVITSISPSKCPAGATTSVTINGQGFGTSPSVSGGSNITVTISSASNTQIQASFAVSSSAAGGNQAVAITAAGQTSNSVKFFVQIPTSLAIASGDSTTPEAQCTFTSGGTQYVGCGVTRSFIYQVNDQAGNPIQAAGLQVWDAISVTSPNGLNITGFNTTCSPANTGPCGVTTNSAGEFGENNPGLTVCAVACRPNGVCIKAGPTNANQTWHVGPSAIVQQISYYCDHITVNGI